MNFSTTVMAGTTAARSNAVIGYGSANNTSSTGLHVIQVALQPSSTTTLAMTTTSTTTATVSSGAHVSSALAYVLIPLATLFIIGLAVFLIIFIVRRKRIDKLRHAMMPVYSYDPEEEGGDWESELLEDDREAQRSLNVKHTSPGSPELKFHPDHLQL
ncbi:uncharacterized protein C3orf18 isoform X1 [Lingula anatina]|uniref:Uncharacterized protein C3orf18 isoform X1 n=1 Tax=Lingula anatina TaxID=7574 RepID=A0A1S3J3A6_LINAN|nr:uncharacterized protein C3orf18 isoform X1 [Lingula anatina]|eukprot:XP_013404890.1 uncharacterized protein C3orf18 isoform X1 [Lingula anatina]